MLCSLVALTTPSPQTGEGRSVGQVGDSASGGEAAAEALGQAPAPPDQVDSLFAHYWAAVRRQGGEESHVASFVMRLRKRGWQDGSPLQAVLTDEGKLAIIDGGHRVLAVQRMMAS